MQKNLVASEQFARLVDVTLASVEDGLSSGLVPPKIAATTIGSTATVIGMVLALRHPDYARALFLAVTPEEMEHLVVNDIDSFVRENPMDVGGRS